MRYQVNYELQERNGIEIARFWRGDGLSRFGIFFFARQDLNDLIYISKATGATLRRFICAIAASFQLQVSLRVRPSAYIIMVSFELALLD